MTYNRLIVTNTRFIQCRIFKANCYLTGDLSNDAADKSNEQHPLFHFEINSLNLFTSHNNVAPSRWARPCNHATVFDLDTDVTSLLRKRHASQKFTTCFPGVSDVRTGSNVMTSILPYFHSQKHCKSEIFVGHKSTNRSKVSTLP